MHPWQCALFAVLIQLLFRCHLIWMRSPLLRKSFRNISFQQVNEFACLFDKNAAVQTCQMQNKLGKRICL